MWGRILHSAHNIMSERTLNITFSETLVTCQDAKLQGLLYTLTDEIQFITYFAATSAYILL